MLNFTLRPRITISEQEYHQLFVLAVTGNGHSADANDRLFYELDHARVVPEAELAPDIVRMGSSVIYRDERGATQIVRLVYPQQANAEAGRISVLTPVGTALLGLRAGQSISFRSRDGQDRSLTVLQASPPRPRSPIIRQSAGAER